MLFSICYRSSNKFKVIRTIHNNIHNNITQKKKKIDISKTTNNIKKESSDNKYIETIVKTVYTSAILDPSLDLDSYQSLAKSLFSLHVKFVQPKEFKYQLPSYGIPEFAFVGRSNVGKSSLISALIKNREIVKISKEPG